MRRGLIEQLHDAGLKDRHFAQTRKLTDLHSGAFAAHQIHQIALADVDQMMRSAVGGKAEIVARSNRDLLLTDRRQTVTVQDKQELLLEAVAVQDEALLARRQPRQTEMRAHHADPIAQTVHEHFRIGIERVADVDGVLGAEVVGSHQVLRVLSHRFLRG